MRSLFLLLLAFVLLPTGSMAQSRIGLKSNLLYGALAYAPNLGIEVGVGAKTTIDLSVGYNGWHRCGEMDDNKKLVHFVVSPEFRYFLCERFNGHFFGLHALYTAYNISSHNLPLLFGRDSDEFRYEGYGGGVGVSYGYELLLTKRWNLEFNLGVGYMRLGYDKYKRCKCATHLGHEHRNYFGPTRVGVTIIYLL